MTKYVLTELESEIKRDDEVFEKHKLERKNMNITPTKTYRASSMPLAFDCPGSQYGDHDGVLINPNDISGTIGTCCHDVLADYVLGKEQPLEHYLPKRGIPDTHKTEIQIMTAIGKRFWDEYGHLFPEPVVEESFESVLDEGVFTGHTDICSFDGDLIHVEDHKTTRLEGCNYSPQMMRYLWLAMYRYVDASRFKYTICFLRDRTIETSIEFTRDDLHAFHQEFINRVVNWDGKTYCPGSNCTYCPRMATCPAHTAMVKQAIQIVLTDPEDLVQSLQDPQCVALYQQVRYVEGFLKKAIDSVKLRCQASDNRLRGDAGKDLILREQIKTTILPLQAWPVMDAELSDTEIAPCLSISKGTLLDTIAAKVGRGMKGKAKDAFMAKLYEAGAVETKPYFVPAIVTHVPQITETVIEEDNLNSLERNES